MEAISFNAWVSAEYSVTDAEGTVIDSSEESGLMEFVYGYGSVLPALEEKLASLKAGDERMIAIAPEDGFGEIDPELIFLVDKADLPTTEIEVGDEFDFVLPTGEMDAVVSVLEVLETQVRCDANHPLAGQTITYQVQIRSVRAATPTEIAAAVAEAEADED